MLSILLQIITKSRSAYNLGVYLFKFLLSDRNQMWPVISRRMRPEPELDVVWWFRHCSMCSWCHWCA